MKPMTILILTILALVLSVAGLFVWSHPAFGRRMSVERRERIEHSANWRNGMFYNRIPTRQFTGNKTMIRALYEFLTVSGVERVPKTPLSSVKTDLKAESDKKNGCDWVVWFGHSSYLFVVNGTTFLVDPLLKMEFPSSMMMKPFKGANIYSPEDMPFVDYLIITHEHWDHLDYATLRDLRTKTGRVVCPLGVGEYIEYWGYEKSKITEMDWDETACFAETEKDNVNIVCLPTRHFSNRLFGRNKTLWASFLVQVADRQVYVGSDGGYDNRFTQIRQKYGQVDLAFMENGQYNTDWAEIHMLPQDLKQAVIDLDAKSYFTVHHDKFALAKHAWNEPDSVARSIADTCHIRLLDQPIGTPIEF